MDICMTATLRPELIERTIKSFKQNLLGQALHDRLIINIDNAGSDDVTQDDVHNVVRLELFPGRIVVNKPETSSFPLALKWAWTQVKGDLFLNLEDDFELVSKFHLPTILDVMRRNPKLAILRFSMYWADEKEARQSSAHKEPHYLFNGSYYAPPDPSYYKIGYYGSPSIIRTSWAQAVLPHIDNSASPEKQLRRLAKSTKFGHLITGWKYGVYANAGDRVGIRDIGTAWRRERGIKKNSKFNFTTWEKKD